MNFKFTKWKVIVSILAIFLIRYIVYVYSPFEDTNLVVTLAPSIFIYLIWSLFEKKNRQ